jgi:(2Fe-2S) ferredoxin
MMTNHVSSRLSRVCHILFCASDLCDTKGEVRALFVRLAERFGELVRYDSTPSDPKPSVACLSGCLGGPVVAIYPDGKWYHHVTEQRLEEIVKRHVKNGPPVDKWFFHLLDRPDITPNLKLRPKD